MNIQCYGFSSAVVTFPLHKLSLPHVSAPILPTSFSFLFSYTHTPTHTRAYSPPPFYNSPSSSFPSKCWKCVPLSPSVSSPHLRLAFKCLLIVSSLWYFLSKLSLCSLLRFYSFYPLSMFSINVPSVPVFSSLCFLNFISPSPLLSSLLFLSNPHTLSLVISSFLLFTFHFSLCPLPFPRRPLGSFPSFPWLPGKGETQKAKVWIGAKRWRGGLSYGEFG